MTVPTESDDFWGKVKSKLKNGKIEAADPK